MRALVIVPARLASTRLPRKALLRETGKYLVQHVWERARLARRPARCVIATDAREIEDACRSFGAEVVMTSPEHPSGTDRCAEAYRRVSAASGETWDLVVNVQGDEPELDPALVDTLIEVMERSGAPMGTLTEPLTDPDEAKKPQVVKAVLDANGRCLYFSRSLIPSEGPWLRHVGMYAFTPAFLDTFTRLAPAELEKKERLEQLRALANGYAIHAAVVAPSGVRGIDTPEDYAAFVARAKR